jgi:hypothetical protein
MSDKNVKGKLKYESPILVSLGGMGKGTGADCTAAGLSAVGYCSATGTWAHGGAGYCTTGASAGDYCTSVGTTATLGGCTTTGVSAGAACTGGGTAAPCGAGGTG